MSCDAELLEYLRPVQDPELRMSMVDLGLFYEITKEEEGKVRVKMTLTTPTCPAAGAIVTQVKERLETHPEVSSAEVELVWEPKWNAREMASEEAKEVMGIW